MPSYQYEAMNAQGQEIKDEIEALSTEEAISKIRNMGYFPTKIKERGAVRRGGKKGKEEIPGKPKKPRGTNGKVKVKKLTQFTRQLSTLQDAGLPILRSLNILEQQQKPGTLKAVSGAVSAEVEAGATLSEAMAKYPKTFNNLYTNMVAAGEAGGVLDLILSRLADFMEKTQKLKSKVKGAMIYPIAVLLIAFLIVMGIMTFVIPKFEEVFKDFDVELPGVTQFLINASAWITKEWGWLYIIATPIMIMIILKLIRLSKMGAYILDSIYVKLPILGPLISKTSIARFTRTLGTLISAGVPILDAINITSNTTGNMKYKKALDLVHESIRRGETFSEPLRKTKVCDSLVTNMIDVGEETGDLDKMLAKIADNYDEEVDVAVGALMSLLEPILVISLGLICGFIVIALFMPMISLIESL